MIKAILAASCCALGITLCIFGSSAFAAIGVIIGICLFCLGIYLVIGFFANRYYPLLAALVAIALGLLLIILCIFVQSVSFFLGGLVFSFIGIVLIPLSRYNIKIILPLCGGFILSGLTIVFAPIFAGWITILSGISLILYSHIIVIFMQS